MSNFREGVSLLDLALPTESLSRPARRCLVVVTIATVVAVETAWLNPMRSILVLAFMCTVPGAALLSFTKTTDRLTVAALSVALSLAMCAAIATVAVWLRVYEPKAMFIATAAGSSTLLFLAPWYRILFTPVGSRSRKSRGGSSR